MVRIRRVGFLLLMGAMAARGHAQGTARADSLPAFRHSIGLNCSTPLAALMGGMPDSPRLGLIWRMARNPYRSWRVQAVADFYDINDPTDEVLETIQRLTDSTLVYRWKNDRESRYTLRFGWEWSDPDEAVTPYYGVDVIAGVQITDDRQGLVTYPRDTLYEDIRPLLSAPGNLELSTDQRTLNFLAGAAFTAGYRFRIRERWMFMLQLTPEVYMSLAKDVQSALPQGFTDEVPSSRVWVQVRLLEAQLAVRF